MRKQIVTLTVVSLTTAKSKQPLVLFVLALAFYRDANIFIFKMWLE
jgi:hypothetical protein